MVLILCMEVRIEEGWKDVLSPVFADAEFGRFAEWIRMEYSAPDYRVYPPAGRIFAAFDECPFERVKAVIIGQDPYHGAGQANGLSFSVNKGVAIPPSLRNIFKEVARDTGGSMPEDGDLTRWARQGVLMLNATLTVREGSPRSHAGRGWERLTDAAVRAVSERLDGVVFMLWGADAIRKGVMIDQRKHLVLTAPHPSPLSAHRGFLGCSHFSKANEYLESRGKDGIQWA